MLFIFPNIIDIRLASVLHCNSQYDNLTPEIDNDLSPISNFRMMPLTDKI